MKIKGTLLFPMCSVVICISLLIHICIPIRAFAQSEAVLSSIKVKRIGVMPFFKGRYGSTVKDTLDASVSKLYFNPESVAENSDRVLTGHVQEALQKRHGEKVVPLTDVTMVFERIPKNGTEDTPKSLAQKTGHTLRANLIIVGTVWRFKERVGAPWGLRVQHLLPSPSVLLIRIVARCYGRRLSIRPKNPSPRISEMPELSLKKGPNGLLPVN